MKTNKSTKLLEGKGIVFLLTVLLWMAGTMSLHAATDYGFWVGSVKVTSSNCNDITGGSIKSGTVKYNPSTNTLTLTNVRIEGTGSGGDVIHNKSREDLTVYFYGENNLSARDTCAIWCEESTRFYVKSGTTTIYNDKEGRYAVYVQNCTGVYFCTDNNSELNITANKDYAIGGKVAGCLHINGNGNITIKGVKGSLANFSEVDFHRYSSCRVTLKATNNSSYPIVKNVNAMISYNLTDYINYSTATNDDPVITSPFKAEFSPSKKSICSSSGSPIYSSDIKITNDYAVLVNSRYFPDANFRSYLEEAFNTIALSQSNLNNVKSLDVSAENISSLQGINYFTELQTLDCSYNRLTTLSYVSLAKLTTLDCSNNYLTSLGYSCGSIQYLYCYNNRLTKINSNEIPYIRELYCRYNNLTTISLPNYISGLTVLSCSNNQLTSLNNLSAHKSTLQTLYCDNNAFTSLNIESFSKLSDFRCSNNPSLKTLVCNNNSSLTNLNVTDCESLNSVSYSNNSSLKWIAFSSVPALETITCTYHGQIAGISLSCSSLKTLNISHNSLSQIFSLSNCPQLSTLDCSYNSLTSLDLWETDLYDLNCSNNQLTSIVLPPSISKINCSNNKFTTFTWAGYLTNFDISNNPNLTSLYIPGNSNLSQISLGGCNALKILDISGCGFSSIYLSYLTALEELYCQNQKNHCMTNLNVTDCRALKKLFCGQNQLSSLDLFGCNALTEIDCSNNQLTSITLPSSSPSLQSISCQANRISGSAMNALVTKLPNRVNSTAGAFKVLYTGTYYEEGNVCLTTHVDKARAKNWNTYQTSNGNNWTLYAGGVPTDIGNIEADNEYDAQRYNMSGQRVGRDYKGVVIVNGKKKVVK